MKRMVRLFTRGKAIRVVVVVLILTGAAVAIANWGLLLQNAQKIKDLSTAAAVLTAGSWAVYQFHALLQKQLAKLDLQKQHAELEQAILHNEKMRSDLALYARIEVNLAVTYVAPILERHLLEARLNIINSGNRRAVIDPKPYEDQAATGLAIWRITAEGVNEFRREVVRTYHVEAKDIVCIPGRTPLVFPLILESGHYLIEGRARVHPEDLPPGISGDTAFWSDEQVLVIPPLKPGHSKGQVP